MDFAGFMWLPIFTRSLLACELSKPEDLGLPALSLPQNHWCVVTRIGALQSKRFSVECP